MKFVLYLIYALVVAIPLVTWVRNYDLGNIDSYALANLAGLLAFTLIFLQIVVGSFINLLRPVVGNKAILNFHIWQGIAAFILAHLHPLFFAISLGFKRILTMGGYVVWGRVALLLIVVSVAAGLLRTLPWMQKHWRWVHRLNYLIFALIYWHSWSLGDDVKEFPMLILYLVSPLVVITGLIYKLIYPKIRVWQLAMHSEN